MKVDCNDVCAFICDLQNYCVNGCSSNKWLSRSMASRGLTNLSTREQHVQVVEVLHQQTLRMQRFMGHIRAAKQETINNNLVEYVSREKVPYLDGACFQSLRWYSRGPMTTTRSPVS